MLVFSRLLAVWLNLQDLGSIELTRALVDGKHVITVEGIGNVEHPHPLQERIAKLHGSQCGFCTPGIGKLS